MPNKFTKQKDLRSTYEVLAASSATRGSDGTAAVGHASEISSEGKVGLFYWYGNAR